MERERKGEENKDLAIWAAGEGIIMEKKSGINFSALRKNDEQSTTSGTGVETNQTRTQLL